MKKVVVLFTFPNVSLRQYDAVWEELRNTGLEHPKGLISHVGAQTSDGGLTVVDVWESLEAFEKFGETLRPLLMKQDMILGQPQILPAHYVYVNQTQAEMA